MVARTPDRIEVHRVAFEQRRCVFDAVLGERPAARQIKHGGQHADLVRAGTAMRHIDLEPAELIGVGGKTHHSTQYFALPGMTQRTPPRGSGTSPR